MTKTEEIPFLLKLGQIVNFNEYDYSPVELIRSGKIDIKSVTVRTSKDSSVPYPSIRISYILDEDVKFVYNSRTYTKNSVILTTPMDVLL